MRNLELVFIPSPGVGHILSTVAFAKLLVNHDQRFSVTIFVMKFPNDFEKFTLDDSIDGYDCIKFVHLPDPAVENDRLLTGSRVLLGLRNSSLSFFLSRIGEKAKTGKPTNF
ncbi:hypothetical protein ACFE04_030364 [Oxalis oulophora]